MATIEKDLFWIERRVENMTVTEWDKVFGVFNDRSSRPLPA
jgi:hypothetical protein